MLGWIYVITNSSKAGLVRVGFSPRDPDLLADELATAEPGGTYVSAYDVLVKDAERMEESLSQVLGPKRESSGWVRMSVVEAAAWIRSIVVQRILYERFTAVARVDVEQSQGRGNAAAPEEHRHEVVSSHSRFWRINRLRQRVYPNMQALYVTLGLSLIFLVLAWTVNRLLDSPLGLAAIVPLAIVLGVLWTYPVSGVLFKGRVEGEQVPTNSGLDAAAEGAGKVVAQCPKCAKKMRVPRGKKVMVSCPSCKEKFPFVG